MWAKVLILFFSYRLLVSGLPRQAPGANNKCGYEACPKAQLDMLNIHFVPHSHDDVGWLKTVDQYHFGGRNNIQLAGVSYTITSVIHSLLADPKRRFIQVESAFFARWWNGQSADLKEKVKMLVEEGRLEFIGGAWSMNDEAATHYHSLVDQFTWGLRFLNDTFGECARPKIGWQIDPFGHSREQASLFAQMGYDGIFFGRLDYQDKANRMRTKSMEMIWKSSNNLDDSEIFTGALYNGYSHPPGFCFDILCRDDPIIDDVNSVEYNLDKKVEDIIAYAHTQAASYQSKNVMFTMGGDFNYIASHINFESMDKLIRGINDKQNSSKVTAFYSTPSCYLKAVQESQIDWPTKSDDFFPYGTDIQTFWVGYYTSRPTSKRFERQAHKFLQICKQLSAKAKKREDNFHENLNRLRNQLGVMQQHDSITAVQESQIDWPTKSDDFFPYGTDIQTFWVGYYTSRPTSKRFERQAHKFLQICKQLSAKAKKREDNFHENLNRLRNQLGVMQQHDSITGTEKQHVADDYHRELTAAILACGENTKSSLNQLIINKTSDDSIVPHEFEFISCLNLNISDCLVSENAQKLLVTVYNPLAYVSNQYVRFPVGGNNYEVRDQSNIVVSSQLVAIPTAVIDIHYRINNATNEIVFQATDVPPLGYKTFFVTRLDSRSSFDENAIPIRKKRAEEVITIGNADLNITFNLNVLLSEISVDGVTSQLTNNFFIYKGSPGYEGRWQPNGPNDNWFRGSGAYIFRPMPGEPVEIVAEDVTITNVIRGELVDEVHQQFTDWISQVVRVYKTEKFVEFEWMVGPIPVVVGNWMDELGMEIVTRFSTSMLTNGEFFTDSNGREMLKRTRNFRETWDIRLEEFVSGNYYPINSKIAIEDSNNRLAILPDRAQGGSSIFDGTVELMVHRRILHDDEWGVDEALNETEYGQGLIARGKHWLLYGKKNQSPSMEATERILQNKVLLSNWLFFDDISARGDDIFGENYIRANSLIGDALPKHVYLMTYEPSKDDSFLIRFEHILEKNEYTQLSQPVKFNLTRIFPGDYEFVEVTLAANQFYESKVARLQFKQDEGVRSIALDEPNLIRTERYLDDVEITLRPMEMRTFVMSPPTHSGIESQISNKFIFLFALMAIVALYFSF